MLIAPLYKCIIIIIIIIIKTAEDTNFKFGRYVPRDSPDITLTNVSKKWAWSRS